MKKTHHLRVDAEVLAYAMLQRTAMMRMDTMFSALIEYDLALIRPWLPPEVSKVLDIGSGVAGIDARLHGLYPDAHVYLLDGSDVNVQYGTETEHNLYNSQAAALRLMLKNGAPAEQVHLMKPTPEYTIDGGGFDLVLSLFSWGWHYPLGAYAEAVAAATVPGALLIVDVRNLEGEEKLEGTFEFVCKVDLEDGARYFYRRLP